MNSISYAQFQYIQYAVFGISNGPIFPIHLMYQKQYIRCTENSALDIPITGHRPITMRFEFTVIWCDIFLRNALIDRVSYDPLLVHLMSYSYYRKSNVSSLE